MNAAIQKAGQSCASGRQRTIYDVAKEAGVSPMTVSRAFNGGAPVAAKTRERIFRIAQKLDYTPNPIAHALAGGRTKTICILWSIGGAPSTAQRIQELSLNFMRRGYAVQPMESLSDEAHTAGILADQARRRTEAVIFQDPNSQSAKPEVAKLLSEFRSVVVCANENIDVPFDFIHHDRTSGIRQAASHFLASGRKRIGYLLGAPWDTQRDKAGAFASALAQAGIAKPEDFVFDVRDVHFPESHVAVLERRCAKGRPFDLDAILCSNDDAALAIVSWLRSRGLRVPQDVAVCGTNDSPWCPYATPSLASIARNDETLIARIEDLTLSRLASQNLPARREYIPFEFVKRASAGETTQGDAP